MGIEKKLFGNTGHSSSRVIFGAAALGSVNQPEADRTLEVLLEYGINHLDVAASYGDGQAEKRMAPWLSRHRRDFFLATKTDKRSYREAKEQLHSSLERLGVDSVDLIQMHNLIAVDEWERALGPGGALEALTEAREQGLCRHIGVTGHGFSAAAMHSKSLERHPFASVLAPYNFLLMQDRQYARDFEQLKKSCREKNVALQTIKSLARRPWPGASRLATWYEPLEDQEDIDRAVHWVLADPEVFLISAGDIHLLPRALQAASRPGPRPSEAQMSKMVKAQDMQMIYRGAQCLAP